MVISGQIGYRAAEKVTALDPGSYFGSEGAAVHKVVAVDGDVVLYVRSSGGYELSNGTL